MATAKQEKRYKAPAVEKALDILEYMTTNSQPISLKQLSEELQKTPSELFRIVDCLVRRGYLIKHPKQNYLTLSLKILDLANGHPQFKMLLDAAESPLVKFCEETHTGCHLSVLDGYNLFVLHAYESPTFYSIRVKTGARFSAWEVNSGRFLLARLSREKRTQILAWDPSFQALEAEQQEEVIQSIEQLSREAMLITRSLNVPVIDDVVVPLNVPAFGTDVMVVVSIFRSDHTQEEKEILAAKIIKTIAEFSTTFLKNMGHVW